MTKKSSKINPNEEGDTSWQVICNYCGYSAYRSRKYHACVIWERHLHPKASKQIIMFQPQTNQSKILYSTEIEPYLKKKREEFLDLYKP